MPVVTPEMFRQSAVQESSATIKASKVENRRQSARQIVILVPRETHEQPAPQRNTSASQHINTSAPTNNKKPTATTATNTNTATNTASPTTINNQQVHSHKKSNTTSHNSGNTQHQPTTATVVPSNCVPERTFSRVDARVCAQKNQRQQQLLKQQTAHKTAWKLPSQRQVTQGPQSPLSGPEQQNARASRQNRHHFRKVRNNDFAGCAARWQSDEKYRECTIANNRTYETMQKWDQIAAGPQPVHKMTPQQRQAQVGGQWYVLETTSGGSSPTSSGQRPDLSQAHDARFQYEAS